MKLEISEWSKRSEIFTQITGILAAILLVCATFFDTYVIGITPISIGVFLWGVSIRELNVFKQSKNRFNLILGILLAVFYVILLIKGIVEINNYLWIWV